MPETNSLKVLVISHMFPSECRPNNGIFVHQQVEALKLLGISVTVVSPIPYVPKWLPFKTKRWIEFQNLPKVEDQNGIKVIFKRGLVIPKKMDRWRGRLYYWSQLLFWKNFFHKTNFDIIHSHSVLPDSDLAEILKRKYKIPVVATIHGADLLTLHDRSSKDLNRILNVLKDMDLITTVSSKLANILAKFNSSKYVLYPVKVIHNGIKIYDDYLKPDWRGFDDSFKIITIASLTKQKNIDIILNTLHDLDAKFFIVGDGTDRIYYEQKVSTLGLSEKVIFLGSMEHQNAMSYLKDADLFVLLSKNEGFGIVYLEAMHHGLITIGSKGEGIEDIIRNGENGYLIQPNQIEELRNLIMKISFYPELFNQIRTNAKSEIWPAYSWENNAQKYIKLYHNLKLKKMD